MAQAGFHGLVGVALRKLIPRTEWLFPGIVPGNLLPDANNLAVAARRYSTDTGYLPRLRLWAWVQGGLFGVFTGLVFSLGGFYDPLWGGLPDLPGAGDRCNPANAPDAGGNELSDNQR